MRIQLNYLSLSSRKEMSNEGSIHMTSLKDNGQTSDNGDESHIQEFQSQAMITYYETDLLVSVSLLLLSVALGQLLSPYDILPLDA